MFRMRQRGITMVEVLVTMVVVAVGLLGIAALILNNLKSTGSAYARAQAGVLAGDMVDRMRANRVTAEVADSPYNLSLAETPDPANGLPQAELTQWRAALAAAVPQGTGSVALDAATSKVTVTVQWNDSRAQGVTAQQLVMETRL